MSEPVEQNDQPTGASPAHLQGAATARRHRMVAMVCAGFVLFMTGAAFAAVPLYSMFCRVTGFGGATRVATSAPTTQSERTVDIRFDSNIAPGLPWSFEPEVRSVKVRLGETKLIYYRVRSRASVPTTAVASYNATPAQAGAYFVKMQCFCFSAQTLAPGETQEMAVAFYVDPALDDDPDLASVSAITLSYTFFPKSVPAAAAPLASGARAGTGAPL